MNKTHPIRFIHAEDMTLFRTGVRNALATRPGIQQIGEAENGQVLLQMLEEAQPDIILLNIQMPVMDGLTTLPVLKKKYPWIKVIILSMHNDPAIIRQMIEAGANGYMTKEAGSEEIYRAILACQQNWFYVNETVAHAFWKTMPVRHIPLSVFSEKERRLLNLLTYSSSLEGISLALDISPRTVSAMIDRLKEKTNSASLRDLVAYAKDGLEPYVLNNPGSGYAK